MNGSNFKYSISDMKKSFAVLFAFSFLLSACGQRVDIMTAAAIKENYVKIERMIPMRDGLKLFTAIYIPKDSSTNYPFLIQRTPYSCSPYGEDAYSSRLGPNPSFVKERYIFVIQDVRGRYMSEGQFQEMTPAIDNKKLKTDVDESSDAYDTVDWLVKNIRHNNGKAGLYGISYPGFYASAALPNAHPAIRAVSPQAPVTDEFEGDDANHRGAFYLMDNFSFMNTFDHPRPAPWKRYPAVNKDLKINDAYDFYLKAGPIKNLNSTYYHDSSKIWNEYLAHTSKDAYWQARDIRKHFKNIRPPVLVVGGWFDAEDMFGALKTYEAIEKQSPKNNTHLIMGPWTHGSWARPSWEKFAGYTFGTNTNLYFQEMESRFFAYYLKGKGDFQVPKATVFITGTNEWKGFSQWPPKESVRTSWYLGDNHRLSLSKSSSLTFDEYVSDPANPVPYIDKKAGDRLDEYMGYDQTFASTRSDVLTYVSETLDKNLTLTGELAAHLFVSISGTDADFIIKVIDVLPDEKQTQQLVRAEVLRGKYRNSFEKPEPFVPGKVTPVRLVLNDVAHSFLKGHKVMVQIQSTWFPLVDRNPQKFVNIPYASESDFQKATIKIYHDAQYPSGIEVHQLP